MTRLILPTLATLLLVTALTACGGGDEDKPGRPTEANFGKITLGMQGHDVAKLVGLPNLASAPRDGDIHNTYEWDDGSKVVFENKQVIAVVYQGNLITGALPQTPAPDASE